MNKPHKRVPHIMQVTEATRITPNMIRVTLEGDFVQTLSRDAEGGNCKLFLPEPGEARAAFAKIGRAHV